MKVTYNDVYNLLMSANKTKQYLVYSYRKQNLPKQSSKNVYKGKQVYLCWVDKSDKSNVALMVLPATATVDLINNCISARNNRGKTKYIPILYKELQEGIRKFQVSSKQVTFNGPKLALTKEEFAEINYKLHDFSKKFYTYARLSYFFESKEEPKVLTLYMLLTGVQFNKLKPLNLEYTNSYPENYFDTLEGMPVKKQSVTIKLKDCKNKGDVLKRMDLILSTLVQKQAKEEVKEKEFEVTPEFLKTLETEHVKLILTKNENELKFFSFKSGPAIYYMIDFYAGNKLFKHIQDDCRYESGLFGHDYEKFTTFGIELPEKVDKDYLIELTNEINSTVNEYYGVESLSETKENQFGSKTKQAIPTLTPSMKDVPVPTKPKEITQDVLDLIDELFPDDY